MADVDTWLVEGWLPGSSKNHNPPSWSVTVVGRQAAFEYLDRAVTEHPRTTAFQLRRVGPMEARDMRRPRSSRTTARWIASAITVGLTYTLALSGLSYWQRGAFWETFASATLGVALAVAGVLTYLRVTRRG